MIPRFTPDFWFQSVSQWYLDNVLNGTQSYDGG